MVKYKHRITGLIANKCEKFSDLYNVTGELNYFNIPKQLVENSNDWELVVDIKDYEILTVIGSEKHPTFKSKTISWQMCNKDLTFWDIHSIKRLSNDEIFTLGDKVESIKYPIRYNGKINKIQSLNGIEFTVTYSVNNGFDDIKSIVHSKTPLFKTSDNIEIFKGDVYWYIPQTIDEIFKCTRADTDFTQHLYFSTEIGAKNYKIENEKRFSLNDIKEVLKFYTDEAPASYIKKQILKDLKNVN